jgi:hypothetical protein
MVTGCTHNFRHEGLVDVCYGLARTLSGSGACLVCRLTDLSRPGEDYGMEGRCRRIGGSYRTEPDRLAYIIARQPGPRWSSFLFFLMFSFLRFTAPRSSSSAIQLVQQLNLVRLLTMYVVLSDKELEQYKKL